ncbi:gamma-type small acid-soluble spore protein [Bacillus sp. S3]|nr:gamma-type small acid-soluble spore protein [Bacillus sp. S3]
MQEVRQQNAQAGAGAAGQFGTEFASETNAAEVRKQNAQSAKGGSQGQFGTEFGSETNAQEVRKQNQAAEARKNQNAGQFGQD